MPFGQHFGIQRPKGLPGYTPRIWCCICGRAAKEGNYYVCPGDGCMNKCHKECLGDNEEFLCSMAEDLRAQQSILEPVTYMQHLSNESDVEEAEEDLSQKSKEELIGEIKLLRAKIDSYTPVNKYLGRLCQEIGSKRDAIVGVLEWIDNLSAAINTAGVSLTVEAECQTSPDRSLQENRRVTQNNSRKSWNNKKKTVKTQNTKHNSAEASTPVVTPQEEEATVSGNKSSRQDKTKTKSVSYPSLQQPPRSNTCNVCHRRGHTEDNCRTKLKCDYCGRTGHSVDWCRSRTADERQERLLKTIVSEQANHTASLLRSLQGGLPSAPVFGGTVQSLGIPGVGQLPHPPNLPSHLPVYTPSQPYPIGQYGGRM